MKPRQFSVVAVIAATTPLMLLAAAPAAAAQTLLVDDDGQQCGAQAHRTIAAALEDAADGDVIRVCPGRYDGGIHVGTSVSILGPLQNATGPACIADPLEYLDDLDLTQVAVVQPLVATEEATTPLMTLAADGIEVAGLVLQGVIDDTSAILDGYDIFTPALLADGSFSGYRIHDNLIRKNTLGIEFGSSGTAPSRVEHNCLRENEWGVANQRQVLKDALIDNNTTTKSTQLAYEVGWGLAATNRVTVQGNTSVRDGTAFSLENSDGARVIDNTVTTPVARAFRIVGGNDDLLVSDNTVSLVGATGLTLLPPSTRVPARSTGVVIESNRFTGARTSGGFGIAIAGRAADGAHIYDNILSGNGAGGLHIMNDNKNNVIRDNVIRDNVGPGIRILGTTSTGNTFRDNRMSGNGTDARDETDPITTDGIQLLSTWTDNQCVTDIPVGAICKSR